MYHPPPLHSHLGVWWSARPQLPPPRRRRRDCFRAIIDVMTRASATGECIPRSGHFVSRRTRCADFRRKSAHTTRFLRDGVLKNGLADAGRYMAPRTPPLAERLAEPWEG
jgi:hypothetical protein